jgi:protocatechuate 4,5-dioxygenase beta chain
MARVLGGLGTSHIPLIGKAIAQSLQADPYWQPFFRGFPPAHAWLAKAKPDVAVVVYNDHGLNFFLDKMPTFAIGAAAEYRNADEGWGIPTLPPYRGDPDLSWHIIEMLAAEEFDLTTCQEMLVDHGLTLPVKLFWPDHPVCPVRVVPISVNTVQHPVPSPARCYKFGKALGRALAAYDEDLRIVVIGTGGLSHQLDGTRAGFINKEFDLMCMEMLVNDPQAFTRFSSIDIVRHAGAQGLELLNWITMRAALAGSVQKIHSNYHIPISNTATGLMVLENRA